MSRPSHAPTTSTGRSATDLQADLDVLPPPKIPVVVPSDGPGGFDPSDLCRLLRAEEPVGVEHEPLAAFMHPAQVGDGLVERIGLHVDGVGVPASAEPDVEQLTGYPGPEQDVGPVDGLALGSVGGDRPRWRYIVEIG